MSLQHPSKRLFCLVSRHRTRLAIFGNGPLSPKSSNASQSSRRVYLTSALSSNPSRLACMLRMTIDDVAHPPSLAILEPKAGHISSVVRNRTRDRAILKSQARPEARIEDHTTRTA
jgi:hypothetical protein